MNKRQQKKRSKKDPVFTPITDLFGKDTVSITKKALSNYNGDWLNGDDCNHIFSQVVKR